MKIKKPILTTLLFASFFYVGTSYASEYEVTVTNITKGQPLTPVVVVAGSRHHQLYQIGEEASQGLKELAQDGATATLLDELTANKKVSMTATGTGLIMPGQSETIRIKADRRDVLSLASMLAKTNDGFVGVKNKNLRLRKGQSTSFLAKVYDAGAEINNESKDYIPALGAPGVGTDEMEGFVHPHPGVSGVEDLNPVTDAFGFAGAKITVKRIK